jgi:Outer membrane protein beta-barrel domain
MVLLVAVNGICQTKSFGISAHFTMLDVGEQTPGFGGTFAYNLNRRIGLESTLDFYPGNSKTSFGRSIKPLGDWNTGSILQGQFGVRVNVVQLKKLALFAKAKPGFISFSNVAYEFQPGIGGIGIGNVSAIAGRQTGFALDFGGGVEVSPVKNTFLRFDAGDTYFQYPPFSTPLDNGVPGSIQPIVGFSGSSVHTFQFSVGVGYKFGRTK